MLRLRKNNSSAVSKTSYYRGAPSRPSPFAKKEPIKNKHTAINKFLDILIIIAAVFCFGYSTVLSAPPKVSADSYQYHTLTEYQSAVKRDSGITQKNKLTYNEKKVVSQLEKSFPEIVSAGVSLPIVGNAPKISLQISKPAFLLKSGAGTFVLDDDGTVVVPAAQLRGASKLLTIQDQSGFNVDTGTRFLSADNISFLESVIKQCQKAKVPISSIILPPRAEEFDLVASDAPYFVKFYLGGNPAIETGQYLAARHKFAKDHISPSEYLDVRVQGKIFYK